MRERRGADRDIDMKVNVTRRRGSPTSRCEQSSSRRPLPPSLPRSLSSSESRPRLLTCDSCCICDETGVLAPHSASSLAPSLALSPVLHDVVVVSFRLFYDNDAWLSFLFPYFPPLSLFPSCHFCISSHYFSSTPFEGQRNSSRGTDRRACLRFPFWILSFFPLTLYVFVTVSYLLSHASLAR